MNVSETLNINLEKYSMKIKIIISEILSHGFGQTSIFGVMVISCTALIKEYTLLSLILYLYEALFRTVLLQY